VILIVLVYSLQTLNTVMWCKSDCQSVYHISEPCKNGWTDRDAVWVMDLGGLKEAYIRWGSRTHSHTLSTWLLR